MRLKYQIWTYVNFKRGIHFKLNSCSTYCSYRTALKCYTRSINLALPTPFKSARTHCCVWKFVRAFVKFVLQSQIAIHNVKMSLGWIHIVNIAISKGILGTFVTLEWKYFTNLFKCGTIWTNPIASFDKPYESGPIRLFVLIRFGTFVCLVCVGDREDSAVLDNS